MLMKGRDFPGFLLPDPPHSKHTPQRHQRAAPLLLRHLFDITQLPLHRRQILYAADPQRRPIRRSLVEAAEKAFFRVGQLRKELVQGLGSGFS